MTPEDKILWREAIAFVNANYPDDCPYYVQLIYNRFIELKNKNK